jgi:hypothetical protein
MSDKKQTALQLFVDKITNNHDKHFKDFYKAEIEEALQMEREQIIEAFKFGELPPAFVNFDAKEYYNETYGGQDEK